MFFSATFIFLPVQRWNALSSTRWQESPKAFGADRLAPSATLHRIVFGEADPPPGGELASFFSRVPALTVPISPTSYGRGGGVGCGLTVGVGLGGGILTVGVAVAVGVNVAVAVGVAVGEAH